MHFKQKADTHSKLDFGKIEDNNSFSLLTKNKNTNKSFLSVSRMDIKNRENKSDDISVGNMDTNIIIKVVQERQREQKKMLSLMQKQELIDNILMKAKERARKIPLNSVYIEMKSTKSKDPDHQLKIKKAKHKRSQCNYLLRNTRNIEERERLLDKSAFCDVRKSTKSTSKSKYHFK